MEKDITFDNELKINQALDYLKLQLLLAID